MSARPPPDAHTLCFTLPYPLIHYRKSRTEQRTHLTRTAGSRHLSSGAHRALAHRYNYETARRTLRDISGLTARDDGGSLPVRVFGVVSVRRLAGADGDTSLRGVSVCACLPGA